MKRMTDAFLCCVVLLAVGTTALAQRNPRGKAELCFHGNEITVEYGRPELNGRTAEQLLARLKAGGFWRLGADTSTTFSTAADLSFANGAAGAVSVPKGSYSLWAQKQADGCWMLVFNKQTGQWGTQHDAAQDLYSAPLSRGKASKSAERVTVGLAEADGGGVLSIHWGDLNLSAKFKLK